MLFSLFSFDCDNDALARLVTVVEACADCAEIPFELLALGTVDLRFLGTFTFGFAENVLVPGIDELLPDVFHPLLLEPGRFCDEVGVGDCGEVVVGLTEDTSRFRGCCGGCSKSISTSSA
jgi:hypothetical protein